MSIDLHMHSCCSDGTCTPGKLVRLAAKLKLSAIALTDHDTTEGFERAVTAGRECGIEVIPGVELSTHWKGKDVHLLGYLFDADEPDFVKGLKWIQDGRETRNEEIAVKLRGLGYDIAIEEVLENAGGGMVGRPHFARVLQARGIVSSLEEAFTTLLGADKPAYVSRRSLGVAEAIAMIHGAGGLAVVAHPFTLGYLPLELHREVGLMHDAGLDGLEVIYPKHSRQFRKQLRRLVKEFNLVATGGSDYHGNNRPGTSLAGGKNMVPDEVLVDLRKRWKAQLQ
ncbi:PHP domain-containing protein [Desulforhopalus vacuolatus]|uniref:PHP domain-containing protein n=1 Tax=Desulforhopalus vacuolatus TaxID=40414 RepID=UPI001963EF79|nr:PHP domain-containing protein [Desulforhopalus vacuolatus]MBM9520981.1 PHP domain-containing protein [Desulforhopalus vacuolatus]